MGRGKNCEDSRGWHERNIEDRAPCPDLFSTIARRVPSAVRHWQRRRQTSAFRPRIRQPHEKCTPLNRGSYPFDVFTSQFQCCSLTQILCASKLLIENEFHFQVHLLFY